MEERLITYIIKFGIHKHAPDEYKLYRNRFCCVHFGELVSVLQKFLS